MKVDLSKAIASPKTEFIAPDKRIEKAMKKHYSGGFMSDIKRALAAEYICHKEK